MGSSYLTKERKILFIVEGQKGEKRQIEEIRKRYLEENIKINFCFFSADVYSLLKWFENEYVEQGISYELEPQLLLKDYLGTRQIKYTNALEKIDLTEEQRNSINYNLETVIKSIESLEEHYTSTFLVFDFEMKSRGFNIDKLRKYQEIFSDETGEGLLIVNYPTVESFRDYESNEQYQIKIVNKSEMSTYKENVGMISKTNDITLIENSLFEEIINANVKKLRNLLDIENEVENISKYFMEIMDIQKDKFEKEEAVYVLSQMPYIIKVLDPAKFDSITA